MGQTRVFDDNPYILRSLDRLREATVLPLTFGGPVTADRQVVLSEFSGANVGAMKGVALDFGRGLGGKVVERRRPLVVNDYVEAPTISHQYDRFITAEGLRAMVAVPVVVRAEVRAVLYCSTRGACPLGDRVVQKAVDAARNLEQDLAVRHELARRMDRLDEAAHPAVPAQDARWEVLRETYTELRLLARNVEDALLQSRLEALCRKLADAGGRSAAHGDSTVSLSNREQDVLACVAMGWTNPQIAADLDITVETVKSYLRSATRKLQARSRWEAVVAARRLGLLP